MEGLELLQATYRGRRLRGTSFWCAGARVLQSQLSLNGQGSCCAGTQTSLPPGCKASVLVSNSSSSTGARQWQTRQVHDSITHWNHDVMPAPSDPQLRALQWLHIAPKVRCRQPSVARIRPSVVHGLLCLEFAPCGLCALQSFLP